jgi:2-hydroxychromene-2-carboxylate isomerase
MRHPAWSSSESSRRCAVDPLPAVFEVEVPPVHSPSLKPMPPPDPSCGIIGKFGPSNDERASDAGDEFGRNNRSLTHVPHAMTRIFGLTYDYRCPFARIASAHVLAGLRASGNLDVRFIPFCLGQTHVEDGMTDIWDRPGDDSGLLALQVSVAVRDGQPEKFLNLHEALFEHRHSDSGSLRDRKVLDGLMGSQGVDTGAVWAKVDSGEALKAVREEHEGYAASHAVWGVPVFVVDDSAVFVRLLRLPSSDDEGRRSIERILDLVSWRELNEFKHTSIPQ